MRMTRTRTAPWKLHWVGDEKESFAYLGRWRVGRVARSRKPGTRIACFSAQMHVPWIIGPVCYEASMLLAKSKFREKLEEWLEGMNDDAPNQESEARKRIRPSRAA